MKIHVIKIVILSILVSIVAADDVITTKSGQVRGKSVKLFDGKIIQQYLGIPFATPPLGDLRYKHPRPIERWNGVLNVTQLPPACSQKAFPAEKLVHFLSLLASTTGTREDCLYLNVYVPESIKPGSKSPVIVFIFGGAYSVGSSSAPLYDGSILASRENLIMVNFNYRVASFGFLYMDHPEMDANSGLMDQVMALRWIHSNIASFGGDPERITLMGQSAGAASVGFHLISDISRKYFSRAIMESGTPVSEWAVQTKEENIAFGRKLIEFYGCDQPNNLTAVVQCLKSADSVELLNNEPTRDFDTSIFRPVIDGFFVKEDPNESMKKGHFKKTEILLGTNRNEGTPFLAGLMPFVFTFLNDRVNPTYEDFLELVPETLRYAAPAALKAIIFEYTPWKNKDDPKRILESSIHMFSDYYFTCGKNDMARYYAQAAQKVWEYYYVFTTNSYKTPKWMGTFHGHELPLVFGYPLNTKNKRNLTDEMFSKRIMRYWANFARTGDPNISAKGEMEGIQWPRYTLDKRESLVMSPNSTAVMTNHRRRQCALWSEFIPYIEKMVKEGKLEKRVSKWY